MTLFIFAIATFINIVVVYEKFKRNNKVNAVLDLAVLVGLSMVFGGTMSGMAIATVASALFSVYLFFSPATLSMFKSTK